MGLTSSYIKIGMEWAMNEGRITINSSTSNPIFYAPFTKNADGLWIYSILINPNYFSNPNSNGIKALIAHEMYHFYKIETGPENQAGANDYHHELMVIDSDNGYKSMLKEIFPGHENDGYYYVCPTTGKEYDFYDMLKFAGTVGTSIFDDLPQAEQDAITDFFETNGIYYE